MPPAYNRLVVLPFLILLVVLVGGLGGGSSQGATLSSGGFHAGFERGLDGFNLAGVGDVDPQVVEVPKGSGEHAAKFTLTGSQGRSELIVGGDGGTGNEETIEFGEGAEAWIGFSFDVLQMRYEPPRYFNLIMQFKGEGEGSPNFAIQLAREGNEQGIWSSGAATDQGRFLAGFSDRHWHRVEIHFRASNHGAGFYALYLDGNLIDQRSGISMIPPGRRHAYVKLGLYRDGTDLDTTSKTLVDSVSIGRTRGAVSSSAR